MTDFENKFENAKDKIVGKTKEAVGRATGDEETELRGKLQSKKGELKDKFEDTKEKIAGKINDKMDEKDNKRN